MSLAILSVTEAVDGFGRLWNEALVLWLTGGWAMVGIAALALVMFGLGAHIGLKLVGQVFGRVPEATWRRWIERPNEREGPIGRLLDHAVGAPTLEGTVRRFRDARRLESAPFERDLRVMAICVSAAPLVGLLGTVIGMLSTFGALASGSGGDKTMALVAEGISEALVTTETGLVVALPGLFLRYLLARGHERYKAFLAHLETVTTQTLYRRLHPERRAPAAATAEAVA